MKRHFSNLDRLSVMGISFHSAPNAVCEGYYLETEAMQAWLDALKQAMITRQESGGFALSTCDRTEIYGFGINDKLLKHLFSKLDYYDAAHEGYFYHHYGKAALHHWLRVACALDSRMVGETQITGQMKAQMALADAKKLIHPSLQHMQQWVHAHSAMIRNETGIGQGIVSLLNAGNRLAQDIFGSLEGKTGLIIGLSEIGERLAIRYEQAGAKPFMLTTPARRGKRIAALRSRHFIDYEKIEDILPNCDMILSAHGTGDLLLTKSQMQRTLARRGQNPVLLIDGGEPTDLDPTIDDLDEAYYYPVTFLHELAKNSMNMRKDCAVKAEDMANHMMDEITLSMVDEGESLIIALKNHFENLRQEVMRAGGYHNQSDKQTRLLMNKLLHFHIKALKEGDKNEQRQRMALIKQIYGIDELDE